MVEAGGVELRRPIENTQVIENNGRMIRKKRAKSSSDVHGVHGMMMLSGTYYSLHDATAWLWKKLCATGRI